MDIFALEKFAEDAFRVKRSYIDIAGDLVSGIVLGQIIFWSMPAANGEPKLKVKKDGELWLVKTREDWFEEIRISPKQADRALKVLEGRGLVETRLYKFNSAPTKHVRILRENLQESLINLMRTGDPSISTKREKPISTKGENGISPKGKMDFPQRVNSLTESTNREYLQRSYSDSSAEARAYMREGEKSNDPKESEPDGGATSPELNSGDVVSAYQQYLGRMPNAYQIDSIGHYLDDGLEPALIIAAIEKTALAGANFTYTTGILNSLAKSRIYTVEAWQQERREKNNGTKRNERHHGKDPQEPRGKGYTIPDVDLSGVDLSKYE